MQIECLRNRPRTASGGICRRGCIAWQTTRLKQDIRVDAIKSSCPDTVNNQQNSHKRAQAIRRAHLTIWQHVRGLLFLLSLNLNQLRTIKQGSLQKRVEAWLELLQLLRVRRVVHASLVLEIILRIAGVTKTAQQIDFERAVL